MILTQQVQLKPTEQQAEKLKATLELCNEVCNWLSPQIAEEKSRSRMKLQKKYYYQVREQFPKIGAGQTIMTIWQTVDSYKAGKKGIVRTFRPHGAMPFHPNCMRPLDSAISGVSIWTCDGREKIPVVMGDYQREMIDGRKLRGEADLIYRDNKFYLHLAVEIPDVEVQEAFWHLGVDMGIKNIAVDSDGTVWAGNHLQNVRCRYDRLRAKLQAKGTKSAKRLLKKRRHKEQRFARDVNHCISKQLILKAKDTGRGIALEDLTGIRDRVTVRKSQRRIHSSWGFYQLRMFIGYKAEMRGVPVVHVDPRNTSRTCPRCGHVAKENRKTRDKFVCVSCGFAGPADHIAAINIGRRADARQPNAACDEVKTA